MTLIGRIADGFVAPKISFICEICSCSQELETLTIKILMPICDQCKKDLKEYVLKIREERINKPEDNNKHYEF